MDVSERAELRAAEHAARAAAEESSARLAAVLDSLPDAAAVFDADWRYTYVNPAARALHDAIHDVVRAAGGPAAEAGGPVVGRVAWEVFPWLVGPSSSASPAARWPRA
jgi:nitrogen fixation/metabolism regulation signal transduction histidine kinase